MNTGIDCKENMLIAVKSGYKTLVCNGGQGKITLSCGDIYQPRSVDYGMVPETYPFCQACALPVPGQATRSGIE